MDRLQRKGRFFFIFLCCMLTVTTYMVCKMYFAAKTQQQLTINLLSGAINDRAQKAADNRVVVMRTTLEKWQQQQQLQKQPQQQQQQQQQLYSGKVSSENEPHPLRVVDYSAMPMEAAIECVPLRTALHQEKICINDVTKDKFISRSLKLSGAWEPQIVNRLKPLLDQCPDCQFLDIGSNIGVYALTAASQGRKVVAVEPLWENLLRLTKSVRINQWENRVTVVSNALSDVYENVSFWRPPGNPGGTHSQSKNVTMDTKIYVKTQDDVPTARMDDLLQVFPFKKAIMKIDIEGYEPRAFRAAAQLFQAVDLGHVFMEWGKKSSADRDQIVPLIEFFTSRGYAAHNTNLAALGNHSFESSKKWPYDIIWIRKK